MIEPRGAALAASLAGLGAAVPLLVSAPPLLDLAILTAYYALLAGSWNLLAGFTGQFSFAHLGLSAVGAYSSALLTHAFGVPVAATLPLAGLMTAAIGAVLGLVSLRVRGVQLPLITFAFSGGFGAWLTGAASITGGARGQPTERVFSGVDYTPYAWLGLALVVLYYLTQWLILQGRLGLFARAVRENERVAEGLGVRSFVVKLVMFTYTAFWAGVSGSLYAAYVGIIAPSMLHLSEMALVVAMVVVGGMGRPLAPLAGVILLRVADHWVRAFGEQYTLLITASITLLVVLISRDGLVGMIERALRGSTLRAPWSNDHETSASREPRQPPPVP